MKTKREMKKTASYRDKSLQKFYKTSKYAFLYVASYFFLI